MKHGNFWMTIIGAGVVIAGMSTASRTATQSPALLFLAGQLKIAAGQTEDGIRLMKQAASKEEAGTVHAAEPVMKATEVCSKSTTSKGITSTAKPRPAAVKLAKSTAKPVSAAFLFAKLDIPQPPAAYIDPSTFRYLTDQQRHEIHQAQKEFEKAERERLNQIRHETRAALEKVPVVPALFPADSPNVQVGLPASLGQMAQ